MTRFRLLPFVTLAALAAVPAPARAACPPVLLAATIYDGPQPFPSNRDEARAVATDAAGNVYVAGVQTGSGVGYDWAVRKYAPDLVTLLASTRYDDPLGADDHAWSITITAAGEVVVAGYET